MCSARREGPKTTSKTADANLDFAFVENAFFHRSLIAKSQQNKIELVKRPGPSLPVHSVCCLVVMNCVLVVLEVKVALGPPQKCLQVFFVKLKGRSAVLD